MSDYYNRQGEPITRGEWVKTMQQSFMETRRVAYDKRGDVEVSTVFLSTNHNYGDGPPLIFETMIFGGEHSDEQSRYTTETQALEGHKTAVALAFGDRT